MKVGFIGLGHMGGPMCHNIIKGRHEVLVHDLSDAAVRACVAVGGTAGGSVANIAGQVEVVMTSLPMPRDVEAVALGPDGIGEHAKPGTIYVDLSTNSPAVMKKIATRLADKDIVTLGGPGASHPSPWCVATPGRKGHCGRYAGHRRPCRKAGCNTAAPGQCPPVR